MSVMLRRDTELFAFLSTLSSVDGAPVCGRLQLYADGSLTMTDFTSKEERPCVGNDEHLTPIEFIARITDVYGTFERVRYERTDHS